MGRAYIYQCPKCAYTAHVSGGTDSGANCYLQTFACATCRRLSDMVVFLRLPSTLVLKMRTTSGSGNERLSRKIPARQIKSLVPPHAVFATAVAKLDPFLPEGLLLERHDSNWVELTRACPEGSRHRLECWNDPGKCPRCGTFMERSPIPFRIWD